MHYFINWSDSELSWPGVYSTKNLKKEDHLKFLSFLLEKLRFILTFLMLLRER